MTHHEWHLLCARCGMTYDPDEHDERIDIASEVEFCPACIEVLTEALVLCPTDPLPPLQ